MGQIKLITALVLMGLFSVAIVSFAIGFANDNDSAISLADDPELSSFDTRVEGNMSDFGEASEDTYSSILNTTISPGSDVPQSAAPFAITPLNALGVFRSILYVAYEKIFGVGTGFGIFLTAFVSIIVLMLGLYVYKTLRGLPD